MSTYYCYKLFLFWGQRLKMSQKLPIQSDIPKSDVIRILHNILAKFCNFCIKTDTIAFFILYVLYYCILWFINKHSQQQVPTIRVKKLFSHISKQNMTYLLINVGILAYWSSTEPRVSYVRRRDLKIASFCFRGFAQWSAQCQAVPCRRDMCFKYVLELHQFKFMLVHWTDIFEAARTLSL